MIEKKWDGNEWEARHVRKEINMCGCVRKQGVSKVSMMGRQKCVSIWKGDGDFILWR